MNYLYIEQRKKRKEKSVKLENIMDLSEYLNGEGTLRRSGVPCLPELQAAGGAAATAECNWLGVVTGGLFSV